MSARIQVAEILRLMTEVGIDRTLVADLKPDLPLLRQGLDSIDLPMLAAAMEERFNADFSEADATSLRTIQDIIVFVDAHRKG